MIFLHTQYSENQVSAILTQYMKNQTSHYSGLLNICCTSTVKNKRKGCENMYQKRKYKHFILLCLVLDPPTMVFLGYRYLDRKIPDEIHIDKNSGLDLSQISNLPFVSFGDTITTIRGRQLTNCLADFLEK